MTTAINRADPDWCRHLLDEFEFLLSFGKTAERAALELGTTTGAIYAARQRLANRDTVTP